MTTTDAEETAQLVAAQEDEAAAAAHTDGAPTVGPGVVLLLARAGTSHTADLGPYPDHPSPTDLPESVRTATEAARPADQLLCSNRAD